MNNSGNLVLHELILPATIDLDLKSATRDAVLEELVDRIPILATLPDARQSLLSALKEREQLYSTGIGEGVALPHARNALTGLVDRPIIVFGRRAQGIPYGAIDGLPVQLFFLLVAPTVALHLAMLARISRLLRNAKLRQDLLVADGAKKALLLIREAELRM